MDGCKFVRRVRKKLFRVTEKNYLIIKISLTFNEISIGIAEWLNILVLI